MRVVDNRNELPNADRFKDVQECARCLPAGAPLPDASRAGSHVRATLGDLSSKFSLYPAPVTNCRCGATIPCDGTICGGRRFAEAEGANAVLFQTHTADARASCLCSRRSRRDAGVEPAPATGAALNNAAAAAAAAIEAMEDVDDACVGACKGTRICCAHPLFALAASMPVPVGMPRRWSASTTTPAKRILCFRRVGGTRAPDACRS